MKILRSIWKMRNKRKITIVALCIFVSGFLSIVLLDLKAKTAASNKIVKVSHHIKISESSAKVQSDDSEQIISKTSYDDVLEDPNIPPKLPKLPLSNFLDEAINRREFVRKAKKYLMDPLEDFKCCWSAMLGMAEPPEGMWSAMVEIDYKQLSQTLIWTTEEFTNWQTPYEYVDSCRHLWKIVADSNTPQDQIEQGFRSCETQIKSLLRELDNVAYPLWISEERFNRFIKALNCRLKSVPKSILSPDANDFLAAYDIRSFSQLRDVYSAGDDQMANRYSILFSNICTLRDLIEKGKLQQLKIFEKDIYSSGFINSLVEFKHELAEFIVLTEKLKIDIKQQSLWFDDDLTLISRIKDSKIGFCFSFRTSDTLEIVDNLKDKSQSLKKCCRKLSHLLNNYGADIVYGIEQNKNKVIGDFAPISEKQIDQVIKKCNDLMKEKW